jgi:hypothetical protein
MIFDFLVAEVFLGPGYLIARHMAPSAETDPAGCLVVLLSLAFWSVVALAGWGIRCRGIRLRFRQLASRCSISQSRLALIQSSLKAQRTLRYGLSLIQVRSFQINICDEHHGWQE